MKIFEGKRGIKVRVLADSISKAGVRLLTYEIEYPRIVHSELMTHRMLSRNAASSRAIPAAKMLEQLTAVPTRFGKNVSGMQDAGEHDAYIIPVEDDLESLGYTAEEWWHLAKLSAVKFSQGFADAGYHKQVFNRLTEPFSMIKVVVTATEWENFFWLRDHDAADPTLAELASLMNDARNASTPRLLQAGQWHLPYVDCLEEVELDEHDSLITTNITYYIGDALTGEGFEVLSLEDAIKISCARCAAVSFRNVDYGVEKSREVYARLVGDQRKHASAFEHCGTPMDEPIEILAGPNAKVHNITYAPSTWQAGISHMDRNRQLWSGNLRGWIQYRKLIDGENYTGR